MHRQQAKRPFAADSDVDAPAQVRISEPQGEEIFVAGPGCGPADGEADRLVLDAESQTTAALGASSPTGRVEMTMS